MARIKVDQKNPDGSETRLFPEEQRLAPPDTLQTLTDDGMVHCGKCRDMYELGGEHHCGLADADEEQARANEADKQQAAAFVAAAEPSVTEAPAQPESRPSLEVNLETHGNLLPRLEALCGRVAGWEMPDGWTHINEAAHAVMAAYRNLGERMLAAKIAGVKVKTTDRSRKEARLALGGPVKLSDSTKALYSYAYSPEELDEVTVLSRTEHHVWVKLGKRENALPIPLKLSQLVLG